MQPITNFAELENHLRGRHPEEKKTVAVVWPADEHTRQAAARAIERGIAAVTFVGCAADIAAEPALQPLQGQYTVMEATDPDDAARKAVALARDGKAHALLKGLINTENLLRAVLDKHEGILDPGAVLSHVTVAEIPQYRKLLLLCDVAVIPYPTDAQFHAMVGYVVGYANQMGISTPRVALTHCNEKINTRHFPFTASYEQIIAAARVGEYGTAIVDGPMDVMCACDIEADRIKGINSPIEGNADGIIFPDILAANTFYKTVTLFCGATMAGLVMGAKVPIALCSRGDTADSKYNALALACL